MDFFNIWINVAENPKNSFHEKLFYLNLLQNKAKSLKFDEIVQNLAMASNCDVAEILPRGEIVENHKMKAAKQENLKMIRKMAVYLRNCEFDSSLKEEQRANLIFAVLKISEKFEKPEESIQNLLKKILTLQRGNEFQEIFAQIFRELSDSNSTILNSILLIQKCHSNEKLIVRLLLEFLLKISQRSEIACHIPSFETKNRKYFEQLVQLIGNVLPDAVDAIKSSEDKSAICQFVWKIIENDDVAMLAKENDLKIIEQMAIKWK